MKKKQGRRNRDDVEAFNFVNVSSMSKTNLHSQSDQITTNATQRTQPHTTVTQPKVVNVIHREIDGDRISTLNILANAVPSLPSSSITSTSTSQILNNSANDEVSYHPMLIDEPDVMIPELDDISNQQSRRQVCFFYWSYLILLENILRILQYWHGRSMSMIFWENCYDLKDEAIMLIRISAEVITFYLFRRITIPNLKIIAVACTSHHRLT